MKLAKIIFSVFFILFYNLTFSQTFTNGPYKHVKPTDVGVNIGSGVLAATPTEEYTGSTNINASTIIENKVINGCLRIDANDVTIRNSIINCNGLYPIQVKNGSSNFKIEYSTITCGSSSKVFYFPSGAPNAIVAYNEVIGCQDFFFIGGDLNGLSVKNNYMHTLVGTSSAHADGFQIGEAALATGDIHIQGNYFDPNNFEIGKTGLIFGTNFSEVAIVLEDNYIEPWGHFTIRSGGESTFTTTRNNVFGMAFSSVEKYILNGGSDSNAFTCNRYADGAFVERYFNGKDLLGGVEHTITGCPEFTTLSTTDIDFDSRQIQLFQNNEGILILNINLEISTAMRVDAYDILGKKIFSSDYGIVKSGPYQIPLLMPVTTGVYLFDIKVGNAKIAQKVIFERH